MRKRRKNGHKSHPKNGKSNLDLSIFLIKPARQGGWDPVRFKNYVRMTNMGYNPKRTAKILGVAVSSLNSIRHELRHAALKNMTLDQYIEQNRPFKYGKKILAK